MITSKTKLAVVAASALALAAASQAQMAPALSTTGFVLGGLQHTSGTPSTDTLNISNALIKFDATYKPVEGVVSLYYIPGSSVGTSGDIHVLDAYVNVDVGSGCRPRGPQPPGPPRASPCSPSTWPEKIIPSRGILG